MLFEKHMRKYYLKYWYFYILGIIALVVVDYVQLYIVEFLQNIVYLANPEGNPEILAEITKAATEANLDVTQYVISEVNRILVSILGIAGIMFAGRMAWRFTLFNAAKRIESNMRHEMFLKSERLSQKYYHENKVGSIMSWFTTDLETIEEYCGFGVVTIVDAFFLGALVIVRMIKIDYVMAIIAFIPM